LPVALAAAVRTIRPVLGMGLLALAVRQHDPRVYFAATATAGASYSLLFAPALDLFNQKHDGVAWRSKPSWSIVATEDRTVHPDLERFAAKRMGATTVELKSSHVPMLSQPNAVLDVIRNASAAVAAKQG
jgi:pimeloyl-ACP methyl ester carboxylesterase